MTKINTDELTPARVFYDVESNSEAERIMKDYFETEELVNLAIRKNAEQYKPIEDCEIIRSNGNFLGFGIKRGVKVPDGWREARGNEPSYHKGLKIIYVHQGKKGGKALAKKLQERKGPAMPNLGELNEKLGFGFGYMTMIGNRFFNGCGYKYNAKKEKIRVTSRVFLTKDGKFYHYKDKKVMDKLPLAKGLKEILEREYEMEF